MANKKISELVSRTPSLTDLMLVGDPSSGYSYKCTVNDIALQVEVAVAGNYVTLATAQTISGAKTFSNVLTLTSVANSAVDTDKFLVLTGTNTVNYRTGAEVLSDIGAQPSGSYVPTTRTLTINGTAYDLSADRTWSVGTVTSVAATAGTGISISGSPITSSGTLTITNTAPDQTVVLTSGTGINVTGTYPSFTIAATNNGTVTSVALATGTTGTDISVSGSPITSSGTITLNIPTASATNRGALSSTDWSTFNNKQGAITLTTTGSSGAATLVGATLNIPNYTLAGLGGVSGSGTTNYIPKFTGTSAIGNSVIYDNGGEILINTTSDAGDYKLQVNGNVYAAGSLAINTSGQTRTITTFYGAGSVGQNIFIGGGGLLSGTGGGANTLGSNNTALGVNSFLSNTTGYLNCALGVNALYNNTTGYQNNAIGVGALQDNTTGNQNNAIGQSALLSNTTGSFNSALGHQALFSNTTGIANSAIGLNSIFANTTGYENTAMGVGSLQNNTTGYYNSAFGRNAGRYVTAGTNNTTSNNSVYLGYDTRASADGNTNEIVIGSGATGNGSNTIRLGNTSITAVATSGAITGASFIPTSSTVPTNGLYLPAANTLGFATNSGEKMRLDASGNLGLGTSSPTYTFDVTGTGRFTNDFRLDTRLITNRLASIPNGNNNSILFNSNATEFYNNAALSLIITSAGNLGLGVSPSAWQSTRRALEIRGSSAAGSMVLHNAATSQAALGANYYFDGTNSFYQGSSFASYYQQLNGQHQWYTAPSGTAGNAISFTQAMTLDASGRLGIGTTSPASLLNVLSTKTTALSTAADFLTLGATIDDNTDYANVGIGGGIAFRAKRNSSGTQTVFGAIDAAKENAANDDYRGALRFWTNQNATGVPLERMRITSGGEILINTTSDAGDYKLQVNGGQYINGVNGDNGSLTVNYTSDYTILRTNRSGTRSWQIDNISNTFQLYMQNAAAYVLNVTTSGNLEIPVGSIKTAAPSGGTAQPWKLGNVVATAIVIDDQYINVEINGVTYNIPTCHPN